jgi:hypothetical protein
MATATFIADFDLETRQTILPVDAEGNPIPLLAMWHVSRETPEGTILIKIKAEDAIMDVIKPGPVLTFLEDFEEVPIA